MSHHVLGSLLPPPRFSLLIMHLCRYFQCTSTVMLVHFPRHTRTDNLNSFLLSHQLVVLQFNELGLIPNLPLMLSNERLRNAPLKTPSELYSFKPKTLSPAQASISFWCEPAKITRNCVDVNVKKKETLFLCSTLSLPTQKLRL